MPNSIRLHKEYGLNPTLCTCFYCGQETGEIALLGANYKGEAPMRMCTSIEPCPTCKEKFKDYVLIVEATLDDKGEPQPAGRWAALPKKSVTVPNKGIMFADTETMNKLQMMTV